jgi:predicted nucleic acid-binding protein
MPDRLVVCNTSPLLYLHQVGRLGLLRDLYGRVQILG